MAAYAAVVSLMNNLEQIKNHPRFFNILNEHQVRSLVEEINFFLDFVNSYSFNGGISKEEVDEFERQFASATHEAEDAVETHIVNKIIQGQDGTISDSYSWLLYVRCVCSLQKPIKEMDSIKKKILRAKHEREFKGDQKPTNSISAASSVPLISSVKSGTSMVGFENELYQLKDVLTGQKSSLQVISIVGMGGAGKTTLAQSVNRDYVVLRHFDLRAWATISQKYKVREILLQILSFSHGKYADETVDKLGERLHKSLFGSRYLIILDDIWSVGIWESIKFFFPDNGNGSRVILTTRQLFIATHLSSFLIRIELLDEHKSWNLFCQEVFGHKVCPPMLVGIGKKIVKQFKGLPLAIVVIGGFLRKSCMTEEHWLKVARNMNAILNSGENEKCLDVLSLSYDNLPARLKPCFLYMGTYKEDCEISVSEVTKLWVAEGFLKPNGVKILEEIAEDYLKDLINRNLIVVSAYRSNGKIKSCRMHDLLRELCLWVADKEKFFSAVKMDSIPGGLDRERRLVFHDEASSDHNSILFKSLESASLARSLICESVVLPVKCKLLRVLHKGVDCFMEDEIRNVNLRYLDLLVHGGRFTLPTWISLIWNLQTLIIRTENQLIVAPLAIWEMQQLRHLNSSMILLLDPPPSDVVLRNLQTLANVVNFRLSEEVCKRIPNIKKLSLTYGDMLEGYDHELNNSFHNLGSLHKLESLNISCFNTISINNLKNAFPSSLNKLCLKDCNLDWHDLSTIIGSLPQLEVLKLKEPLCEACKWSCFEGGFNRLKFLHIEYCALKSWISDTASCFPVLEKLVLVHLWDLTGIPSGIGEIPTLRLIRLDYCTQSAAISAIKMKTEQEYYGVDDGVQVEVVMSPENCVGFRQRVIVEGLFVNNVQLQTWSDDSLSDESMSDED